jgi:hypothetical protein
VVAVSAVVVAVVVVVVVVGAGFTPKRITRGSAR